MKGMATHSSTFAWRRILWTEEAGWLSPWGRKESDTTEQLTLSWLLITNEVKLGFFSTMFGIPDYVLSNQGNFSYP